MWEKYTKSYFLLHNLRLALSKHIAVLLYRAKNAVKIKDLLKIETCQTSSSTWWEGPQASHICSHSLFLFLTKQRSQPGGLVGNILAWHIINPGSSPCQGDTSYIVTSMITIMVVSCHWIPSGTSKTLDILRIGHVEAQRREIILLHNLRLALSKHIAVLVYRAKMRSR